MLVYKRLLTITLTWQSSCVMQTIIENLFVQEHNLAMYFDAEDVKKHMPQK